MFTPEGMTHPEFSEEMDMSPDGIMQYQGTPPRPGGPFPDRNRPPYGG
jgi:hypothetical protein